MVLIAGHGSSKTVAIKTIATIRTQFLCGLTAFRGETERNTADCLRNQLPWYITNWYCCGPCSDWVIYKEIQQRQQDTWLYFTVQCDFTSVGCQLNVLVPFRGHGVDGLNSDRAHSLNRSNALLVLVQCPACIHRTTHNVMWLYSPYTRQWNDRRQPTTTPGLSALWWDVRHLGSIYTRASRQHAVGNTHRIINEIMLSRWTFRTGRWKRNIRRVKNAKENIQMQIVYRHAHTISTLTH